MSNDVAVQFGRIQGQGVVRAGSDMSLGAEDRFRKARFKK
jgi:hypothetical protein